MQLFNSSKENDETGIVPLKQMVLDYLNQKKMVFKTEPGSEVIRLDVAGENGRWRITVIVAEEHKFIHIKSFCPVSIRDVQKLKMAELLCRLNNMYVFGNFNLNFEEGTIVFKTTNLFAENNRDYNQFGYLFEFNVSAMDQNIPVIIAVNSGYIEPVLATTYTS